MAADAMLVHSVYFSLIDRSPAARQRLVAACKQLLPGHRGIVFFAAGTLAEDISWSVSDRDFDVALHIVFENRAAHDDYQDSPRHTQFLEQGESNWRQLRVFDVYAEGGGARGEG